MSDLLSDFRFGLRQLRRSPGFSTIAILALSLGIGANTAIFSVIDALLLAQLPYSQPERIVAVWEDSTQIGFPRNTPAPANWVDWRKQNTVFTEIAASRGAGAALVGGRGNGTPEQVRGRMVTASFWQVMGARPAYGRVFTEAEDRHNVKVVVIADSLWQRRFGGDPQAVGQEIRLDDVPHEVIGVMPRGFVFPTRETEYFVPASFSPETLARRGSHFLRCVARLKPGVTVEQAQNEMRVIAARLAQQYPETNEKVGAVVVPLREELVGSRLRIALLVLFGAAGFVLLIACANLANLLLARSTGRSQEMAVRSALGAGRLRLVRQMLSESLLLAFAGSCAGLAFARMGLRLLEKLVPVTLDTGGLTLDNRALLFTLGVAVLTTVLFGLAPAISISKVNLHDSIKQAGRGSDGGRQQWMRDGLVVVEVALSIVLLTGAGLMIRTLDNLQRIDTGMTMDHLLTAQTFLPRVRYAEFPKREAFFNSVLDKIKAIPGVTDAAYTSDLPLTSVGNTNSYMLEGQSLGDTRAQDALIRVVTPGFFPTLKARLREGRYFTADDRASTLAVAVINETFADRHWRGESPIGKRMTISFRSNPTWFTIVGVVHEIRERGLDIDLKPALYLPHAQAAGVWAIPSDLVIRTAAAPESVLPAVREAVWSVDRDQPLAGVRTMEEVAELELAPRRQQMALLAVFAGLALTLALIGIYGVLSYAVAQRTREIAIRMSLGAHPANILTRVVGRGMILTGFGVVAGLAGSLAAGRIMSSMLFEVKAQDPNTLVVVPLLLLMVALIACAVPAWRAARVEPVVALRSE